MQARMKKRSGARGNAVVEVSLLAPWMLFLFMGVFDFGFYAYALISTENAARTAAAYLATSYAIAEDEAVNPAPPGIQGTCQFVLGELKRLPNVGNTVTNCNALPVRVTVAPPALQADGSYSTMVTVTYRTVPLFPIPWLSGQLTVNRSVQMRVFGE